MLSPYFAKSLLDHGLHVATYTPPASYYVGLNTGDNLTLGAELSGSGYSRVLTSWLPGVLQVQGAQSQSGVIGQFPQASADWLPIYWYSIFDARTGGNWLFSGSILPLNNNSALIVPAGSALQLQAGSLLVHLG